MKPVFRAVTDQQEILEWYPPQSWSHVFSTFKTHCNLSECSGVLMCGNTVVRRSGRGCVEDSVLENLSRYFQGRED